MAISTFTELKTAITDWMARSDVSGSAEDFIALAEAQLNRELEIVETDVTLTGVVNSREIDVSAYSIIEPIALWVAETGQDEERVQPKAPGGFPYLDDTGEPGFFTYDDDKIKFNRKLDSAYPFRFRYRGTFALSDIAPTNKLLTDHPDVYLAASLVWGGIYVVDEARITGFTAILDKFMGQTKSHLAQTKRAVLSVDPMFASYRNDDWWTQQ